VLTPFAPDSRRLTASVRAMARSCAPRRRAAGCFARKIPQSLQPVHGLVLHVGRLLRGGAHLERDRGCRTRPVFRIRT
jgi:hypothetical protein